MRLQGSHHFRVPREAVWSCLFATRRLAAVLPGCERFEQTGPTTYALALRIGMPLLKGLYEGTITVTDATYPARFALSVDAAGPAGRVRGTGVFQFVSIPPPPAAAPAAPAATPQHSRLVYDGTVEFGGMLRFLGAQAVSPAARAVIERFFQRLEAEILAHEAGWAAGSGVPSSVEGQTPLS